jgi:hypothetical protein
MKHTPERRQGYLGRMILPTWNVKCGFGTAAGIDLADQLAADVVFVQEASDIQGWKGSVCHGQVPQLNWGSSVLVRDGTVQPADDLGLPRMGYWRTMAPHPSGLSKGHLPILTALADTR